MVYYAHHNKPIRHYLICQCYLHIHCLYVLNNFLCAFYLLSSLLNEKVRKNKPAILHNAHIKISLSTELNLTMFCNSPLVKPTAIDIQIALKIKNNNRILIEFKVSA